MRLHVTTLRQAGCQTFQMWQELWNLSCKCDETENQVCPMVINVV